MTASSPAAAPLVVVGDALLDVDVDGRAGRLMPDAPAPVVDDPVETLRPGGAALAACLAARAGSRPVVLVTALADDEDAERLAALVAEAGVELVRLRRGGTSTVKRRVRADGVTLARLDTGVAGEVEEPSPDDLGVLGGAAAVVVSDYGRGLTSVPAVRAALADAARRCPVVWDPHPRGAAPVADVRLVVPNRAEAGGDSADLATLAARGAELRAEWGAHAVAVTLGARGALLCQGDGTPAVVPAPRVRAVDPCGAGDRFAVAAGAALASGALVSEAVQVAVERASAFVAAGGASSYGSVESPESSESSGPAAGSALEVVEQVRAAGGTVVATGGCFDLLHAGHVATLAAARALGDCLVVCLNSDSSVRGLKGPTRPLQNQDDRATVLSALASVDAVVVFDEPNPEAVLDRLRPDVWVKGGDYSVETLPEARLLAEWGGQAVVVPYLRGRSTTGLVEAAARP